jgi:hypothetical protein
MTTATTTLCFTFPAEGFDRTSHFIVQVVGVDRDGEGIYHPTYESAMEYATTANSNGHSCFIHLRCQG